MNTDYTLEGGASRNFEAAKTAELLARAAQKEFEEEELNNPMKVRGITAGVAVVWLFLLYWLRIVVKHCWTVVVRFDGHRNVPCKTV